MVLGSSVVADLNKAILQCGTPQSWTLALTALRALNLCRNSFPSFQLGGSPPSPCTSQARVVLLWLQLAGGQLVSQRSEAWRACLAFSVLSLLERKRWVQWGHQMALGTLSRLHPL